MNRNQLNPFFRNTPKWVLLLLVFVIGFPYMMFRGLCDGLSEGWKAWVCELGSIWELK